MRYSLTRRLLAEFLGTFWLVFGGCGSAVISAGFPQLGIGFLGVSLAFGLTVLTAFNYPPLSGGFARSESGVIICVTPITGASSSVEIETGQAGWQIAVAAASIPDKRLQRRLRRLLEQLSAAPGKPVPAACGDWAATKAAYRFFDNPRVTEHGVLSGHFAATAARSKASEGPILILQDTTEFIYSRESPGKIGFTKTINAGRYKAGQPNTRQYAAF